MWYKPGRAREGGADGRTRGRREGLRARERRGERQVVGRRPGHYQSHWQGDGRPLLDRRGARTPGSPSAVPHAPQGGRGLLRPRRRGDLPRRRADDKGATRLVSLRPKGVSHAYTVESGP